MFRGIRSVIRRLRQFVCTKCRASIQMETHKSTFQANLSVVRLFRIVCETVGYAVASVALIQTYYINLLAILRIRLGHLTSDPLVQRENFIKSSPI